MKPRYGNWWHRSYPGNRTDPTAIVKVAALAWVAVIAAGIYGIAAILLLSLLT